MVDARYLDDLSETINNFEFEQALVKLQEVAQLCRQNGNSRARTVVEQILGGPEVPGDQNASDNAEHALPALVHEGQWHTFAFVRLGRTARRSSWSVLCADPRWQVSCAPGGGMRAAWAERHVAGSAALATCQD